MDSLKNNILSTFRSNKRHKFGGKYDGYISLVGATVGFTNLYSFPYYCWKHGGSAYLIVYGVMMIFVGAPMCYMEIAMGQFTGKGLLTCWDFAPLFKGLGISQAITTFMTVVYYNVTLAWTLLYIFRSAERVLPWTICVDDKFCEKTILTVNSCDPSWSINTDGSCTNPANKSLIILFDRKQYEATHQKLITTSSRQFWKSTILHQSTGPGDINKMIYSVLLCLLGLWVIVAVSLARGIKSFGKVMYVTTTIQYLLLFALFGKCITLDGAYNGIATYVSPKWSKLSSHEIWFDAIFQVLLTLSIGQGPLLSLSAHANFDTPLFSSVLVVVSANVMTSLITGCASSCLIGWISKNRLFNLAEVTDRGPEILFAIYPEVLSNLTSPNIWCFMFYLLVMFVGIDSVYAYIETLTNALVTMFTICQKYEKLTMVAMCLLCCIFGIVFCTDAGIYYFLFLEDGLRLPLIVHIFTLSMSVAWIYGAHSLRADINAMVLFPISYYWPYTWFCLPVFFLGLSIYQSYISIRSTYFFEKQASMSTHLCKNFMALILIVIIPLRSFTVLRAQRGNFLNRMKNVIRPTKYWGPIEVSERKQMKHFPKFVVDPYSEKNDDPDNCGMASTHTSIVPSEKDLYAQKMEREQAEREQAEREQAEREQAERKQAKREQAEREQAERKQAEREQAEREQAEREQAEREQAERLKREQAETWEREQTDRKKMEREEKERKRAELLKKKREQEEIKLAEREKVARKMAEKKRMEREKEEKRRFDTSHLGVHDRANSSYIARSNFDIVISDDQPKISYQNRNSNSLRSSRNSKNMSNSKSRK